MTVCPGATTTFIRTGTDENGDVRSRHEYTVTVFPLGDLTIGPEAPVFCAEPVTLTTAEGFEHYVWLDEMGNELGVGATCETTAPGVYTAEAEDSASGCLVRAGVEMSGTFAVEIAASEALLCQEAATPVILDAGEGIYLAAPALFSGLNCGGKKIPADSYAALIDKAGIGVEQSRKFTQWLLDDGVDVAIVHKLNERIAAGEVAAVEKYFGIWRQGDELGLPAETLHTLSKDVLLGGGDELLEALAGRPGLVRAWETAVQHGDDRCM